MDWRMSRGKKMREEKIWREERQKSEQVIQELSMLKGGLKRIDESILDGIVGGAGVCALVFGDGGDDE